MFVMLCEYEGNRHINPMNNFPNIEVIGPFKQVEHATEYEREHRYEGCKKHSIAPMIETMERER